MVSVVLGGGVSFVWLFIFSLIYTHTSILDHKLLQHSMKRQSIVLTYLGFFPEDMNIRSNTFVLSIIQKPLSPRN